MPAPEADKIWERETGFSIAVIHVGNRHMAHVGRGLAFGFQVAAGQNAAFGHMQSAAGADARRIIGTRDRDGDRLGGPGAVLVTHINGEFIDAGLRHPIAFGILHKTQPVGRAALTVVHLVRIGAVGLDGQSAVNAGNAVTPCPMPGPPSPSRKA